MAAGDVLSVSVIPTGDAVDIVLSGLAIGGTYAMGFGANNDPRTGTPKITLTPTSLGYLGDTSATTRQRSVYGTVVDPWPTTTAFIAGAFTSGTFVDGETVTASVSGRTAIVVGTQLAGTRLYVKTVSGATNAADIWTGGTSGATFQASATHSVVTEHLARERFDGTNTTVRVVLSECIYQKDNTGGGNSGTAVVCNILSGFYTSAGTPNNATGAGFAVTNNSTEAYPQAIANWSMPAKQLISANSFKFRVVADAIHGIAAVKVTITDEDLNTATATVTARTIESTEYGDMGPPILEYIADISLTGLVDHDELTADFQAYPNIGDSAAIRTTVGGAAQPTPLASGIKFVLNRGGTYERRVAVVDSTNGNDGTGATVALADFNSASPPAAFLDIESAAEALDAAMTRSDIGGCIIYLRDNSNHAWTGGTVTASARKCHVEVRTFPLDTRATLASNSGSANLGANLPIKLADVNVTPAANTMFATIDYFWMDDVTINDATSGGRTWSQCDLLWFTRCTFERVLQKVGPFSTETTAAALVRGCAIATGFIDAFVCPFVFIGNKTDGLCTVTNGLVWADSTTSSGIPNPNNVIWSFNELRVTDGWTFRIGAESRTFTCEGWMICQNLSERKQTTGAAVSWGTSNATGKGVTNVVMRNNTCADWKMNMWYNEIAGNYPTYKHIAVQNNILAVYACKSDDFSNDGASINNWHPYRGVNFSGNAYLNNNASAPSLANNPYFIGLSCKQGDPLEPDYVDDQSTAVTGTGNGDYHLEDTSPAVDLQYEFFYPYDIEGNARSATDAAGAYRQTPETASGGFFFMMR